MAILKSSTNNKCWRGCEEKGILLHWQWDCKLVQPLWRTVWRFLKKLRIELPYDTARGFPGGASGKDHACHCRRHERGGFDPWMGQIPWRRKWQLTPVFLPGESHEQSCLWATVHGITKSRTQLRFVGSSSLTRCPLQWKH